MRTPVSYDEEAICDVIFGVILEYVCGDGLLVSTDMKRDFTEYGYVIVRGLLDAEEVRSLRQAIEEDPDCSRSSFRRSDSEGGEACSVLWNDASDDITGAVCRAQKVAGTMEALLGSEIYPYHLKVSMKEAYSGGAFVWHQDYGYWYEDGCLFPNMGTVYIALDRATKENGCLKILVGSHRAGRVDHVAKGNQAGAEEERVELLSRKLPLLYAELGEGDAIFFHCNILHRSDKNTSPNRRWGFLVAYNTSDNSPVYSDCHFSATYRKMEKLPNTAIKDAGVNMKPKDYLKLEGMKTAVTKLQQKLES